MTNRMQQLLRAAKLILLQDDQETELGKLDAKRNNAD